MSHTKLNALCLAKLVRALMDDEMSYRDLAEATGLYYLTVVRYVNALHKERVVHLCEYRPDKLGRKCIRVFAWGEGRDVKRPVRVTDIQRKRISRARKAHLVAVHAMAGRLAA